MLKFALIITVLLILALSTTAWWLVWSPAPKLAAIRAEEIEVGSAKRTYTVFVPSQLAAGAPVLIVLHGSRQTGETVRLSTGGRFDQLGEQHGFLVAYPDGINRQWNDCRPKAPPAAAVDDVGFVAALSHELSIRYGVDRSQVFLFGYSNGGQMVFRLLDEELPGVAGAATMGANRPIPEHDLCRGTTATPPLLLAHGTDDPVSPYGGGTVSIFGLINRGMVVSAEQTAALYATRNGLNRSFSDQLSADVARRCWTQNDQVRLEHLSFLEAGHVVPQPAYRFPRILGRTPQFDLPSYVVNFFGLQHRRNAADRR